MDITTVATVTIAVLTALGAVLVVWEVRSDHMRRRRQATIETWIGTRDRRRELRDSITNLREPVLAVAASDDGVRTLTYWLGDLEFVALGVNTGIFDFETINRMSGSYLIRVWRWVEPWAREQRKERSPTLYVELEQLASRVAERREADGTMPVTLDIRVSARRPDTDAAVSEVESAQSTEESQPVEAPQRAGVVVDVRPSQSSGVSPVQVASVVGIGLLSGALFGSCRRARSQRGS